MEAKDIALIISAVTALVAVIVGPLVSMKIAKMNVRLPRQEKWATEVRDIGAEFIGKMYIYHFGSDLELGPEQSIELRVLSERFSAMLNSDDPNQKKLLLACEVIWDLIYNEELSKKEKKAKAFGLLPVFRKHLEHLVYREFT